MRIRSVIIIAVLAVLAGASMTAIGAFAAKKDKKADTPAQTDQRPTPPKQDPAGKVSAVSDSSLTVKLTDGTTLTAARGDRTFVTCGNGLGRHGGPGKGGPRGDFAGQGPRGDAPGKPSGADKPAGPRGERPDGDRGFKGRTAPTDAQREEFKKAFAAKQAECVKTLVEGATVQRAQVELVDGKATFQHIQLPALSASTTK